MNPHEVPGVEILVDEIAELVALALARGDWARADTWAAAILARNDAEASRDA